MTPLILRLQILLIQIEELLLTDLIYYCNNSKFYLSEERHMHLREDAIFIEGCLKLRR